MFFSPVTCDELYKLIMQLKNNKSPGPDNIGPKLIKYIACERCYSLLCVFNLSFDKGLVPDKLKLAKVVPVFKGGNELPPNNYRPISLLNVFGKLLEKLMAVRLYGFLDVHNILYDYQFGFRKNHSTTLALIDVVNEIFQHLDKDEIGIGIWLDLKKTIWYIWQ